MRSVVERSARVVAIVVLFVTALTLGRWTKVETSVRRALTDWTTQSVRLTLDSTVSPVERDWLAALRRDSVRVEWSWRRAIPTPIAVAATPLADPAGATRVGIAAPGGAQVVVSDRLGPIDTAHASSGGLTVVVPAALDGIQASGARTTITDSLILRPILVLGSVDWETKFVVRSLEERGWHVETRLLISPKHRVLQGSPMPLDTGHYAAVLAMDSGARQEAPAIRRYADMGGGVIVAGSSARYLGAIPHALRVTDDTTWRIRMDSAAGPARHRALWAGLVAQVAYAPRVRVSESLADDPAPVATTVERLGPPTPAGQEDGHWLPPEVWFAVLAAALLVDWGSRRLRGAP